MSALLRSVVLRLAACGAVTYVAWRAVGPAGIAWCAPLFGAALARPLIEAVAGAYGGLRAWVYRDVQGRHHAYRGIAISVVIDDEGHPWLRLSDVRKILPGLVRDESLRRILGADVGPVLPDRALHIRAAALVATLARSTSVETARFSRWVQRTVIFPAETLRQRRPAPRRDIG